MPFNTTLQTPHYPIYIGNVTENLKHFFDQKQYSQIIVLIDTNTELQCLPLLEFFFAKNNLRTAHISVPDGEIHKNLETAQFIWSKLLQYHADRNALLINLGGGVLTDMGGFCASTYKRGIPFLHIPTTLLAQVDASVGGKLGIDFQQVKNIIGTFAQPQAVFIDSVFLKTLPQRQLYNGFAEVIKHALITPNTAYWEQLQEIETLENLPQQVINEIILRSICIKNDIVNQDFLEQNIRKTLNFGHTLGHALETYSLQHTPTPLLHGEAIAIGMIIELEMAMQLPNNELNIQQFTTIKNYIQKFFNLQYTFEPDIKQQAIQQIIEYMQHDKKNKNTEIQYATLSKIGTCHYNCPISNTILLKTLNQLF